jgi:hypothetical protein
MNGMSRFLSRRDKHHEKRASKHANTKVRLSSFASVNSLSPLLRPAVDTVREGCPTRQRRLSSSIETLYHKLPFSLRTSVEDSFLFLNRQLPSRASSVTPVVNQTSSTSSSDYMRLQSSPPNVSPDLYRIFTSEGPRPPASKDGDQKVTWKTACRAHLLIAAGQDALDAPARLWHIEHGRRASRTRPRMAPKRYRQSLRSSRTRERITRRRAKGLQPRCTDVGGHKPEYGDLLS